MSLNFGWTWVIYADRGEDPHNKSPESLALSKAQESFYYESLPWLMVYVGLPCVTVGTIPVIAWRMRILDAIGPPLLHPKVCGDLTLEKYLEPFIGFQTNVAWVNDTGFLNIIRRHLKTHNALGSKPVQREANETMEGLRKSHLQYVAPRTAQGTP